MIELLFVIAYLLPILIPVAIIAAIVRARRTSSKFKELETDVSAIRGEIHRIGKRLGDMETTVHDLHAGAGHVARVAGEPEMGVPAKRAAKPAVKPREKRAKEVVKPALVPKPESLPKPEPVPKARAAPPPVAKPRPAEIDTGGVQAKEPPAEAHLRPIEPSAEDRLVARLLENWTGILGTVVLVAGIGFLGTYAAMRMTPFARFVLVLVGAAALYGGYLALKDRERWAAMSLWLRSAAAAVFLFACAASGGLPNVGLMWIESAGPALALLMVGVAVNLALAWTVGRESFATLHVVLSLIPMAILPQATMTLGILTAIAVFAVLLAQRQHWSVHLPAAMLLYAGYHAFWIAEQGLPLPLPGNLPALAVGSAVIVYFASALTNYREAWASRRAEPSEVITHLASWGALVAAFWFHLRDVQVMGTDVIGPVLLASGLVAFGLSINARRRKIEWLRDADVLIAQALVLGSLLTWRPLLGPPIAFTGLVFLETLLFLRLIINDGARPAVMVGTVVATLAAAAYLAAGAGLVVSASPEIGTWQLVAAMVAGAAVTILSGAYLARSHREKMDQLFGKPALQNVGVLAAMMVMVAIASLFEQLAVGVTALAMVGGLYYASRRFTEIGLAVAVWLTALVTQVVAWFLAYDAYASMPLQQLAQLAPAAVLTGMIIWQPPGSANAVFQRQAAMTLLGASVGLSAYLLFSLVSALLPTVVWGLLSLAALETANRLTTREYSVTVLNLGYAYVFAAAVGYVTVVLPTLTFAGDINLRLIMEVFGVGALLYWWAAKPSESLADTRSWRSVHPYFLELAVALVATSVLIEVQLVWRPLVWMAFAFLFLAPQITRIASRFFFYSLAAYITSIIAVAVNVSTAAVPSGIWYEQPWNTGLVAIAVQLGYLFVAYRHLQLQQVTFQPGLKVLKQLSEYLSVDRAATLCYPFFAGLALFLAWRFERTLLTFLWASEVFAILILSVALRKNHFRLVALAGMGACLFRLVFYDMQEADLFVRGLVFVGVGGLMLGMNAVYNKYGARVPEQ
jgi:hypothetical protein